jgi:pilus assembly protein Flp/PilA
LCITRSEEIAEAGKDAGEGAAPDGDQQRRSRNAMWGEFWAASREEGGQALVEYGLLVALIAVVCIVAITALGGKIDAAFNSIVNAL